jgi:hypothetical protein
MKFEFYRGLIWIPISIEYQGKAVRIENCIVDTGSATTAIDIDLIDFDYRKPSVIKRLCGIGGGSQEVICQKISKFLMDKEELNDVEIEFGDIKSDFGINGFIGNDILKRFVFTIDFSKQKIDMINMN